MMKAMSPEERDMFDMDPYYIHFRLFLYTYLHGLKWYTLRNEVNDEPITPCMINHLLQPMKGKRVEALKEDKALFYLEGN